MSSRAFIILTVVFCSWLLLTFLAQRACRIALRHESASSRDKLDQGFDIVRVLSCVTYSVLAAIIAALS